MATTDTGQPVRFAAAMMPNRWHGCSPSSWRWLPEAEIDEQAWLRDGWIVDRRVGREIWRDHGGWC